MGHLVHIMFHQSTFLRNHYIETILLREASKKVPPRVARAFRVGGGGWEGRTSMEALKTNTKSPINKRTDPIG